MSRFDSNVNVDVDAALIPIQSRQAGRPASRGNPAAAIASLNQTTSNPPTQAEVQAIANKVDALLAALRAAGQLAP